MRIETLGLVIMISNSLLVVTWHVPFSSQVQWPFNKADHEYIAAMAGLTVPDQPGIGGSSSSNGTALAEEEAPAAEAEGQQPAQGEEGAAESDVASELAAQLAASAGSEEEGGAGALPAPEPVRIQEEWYRKDANEVLQEGCSTVAVPACWAPGWLLC